MFYSGFSKTTLQLSYNIKHVYYSPYLIRITRTFSTVNNTPSSSFTEYLQDQPSSSVSVNASLRREGWLFIDSVFPVRLGTWDLRHFFALSRKQNVVERLKDILSTIKTRNFECLRVEPRVKDGGVFVKFGYSIEGDGDPLNEIVDEVQKGNRKKGGLPSWVGVASANAYVVRGQPWREDLDRFASSMLKVSFDGPDIRDEYLYAELRPYGRIADIVSPGSVPAGTLRSAVVTFKRVRAAAAAHNCLHGLSMSTPTSSGNLTKLFTVYETPIKAHVIRDWMSSHPRIVVPVLIFLIGSITYTIFDPIRVVFVEAKMLDWFDFRKSKTYKWIREYTVDRLSFTSRSKSSPDTSVGLWKERKEAEAGLQAYLADMPNTLTFVHGPQGSGKSRMLEKVIHDISRPVLTLDCNELYKAKSDSALVIALARQTGYWPVFSFVDPLYNLIDIASVGLIGQKAGLSSSMEEQVQQMLDVVGTGIKHVTSRKRKEAQKEKIALQKAHEKEVEQLLFAEQIRKGSWHDGRIDCVAGNGVMSELGVGIESITPDDVTPTRVEWSESKQESGATGKNGQNGASKTQLDIEAVKIMPIVIVKNFATQRGRDNILAVVARWAASLVESQAAHVVVLSDNRENAKQLAQALPSKHLNSIALSDADVSTALSFVTQKLHEVGVEEQMSSEQRRCIQQLGGRASDLELLVHKVHSGQAIEDAVEDIINRAVGELRKNAFGEDAEDAKSLPWTREQAWAVLRPLSKEPEIAYHNVLLDFPFKGDEAALRSMEHSELITIVTQNGRPSTIRPGRPVYRYVFERLVSDHVFQAVQEIAYNDKLITGSESTIRSCEDELLKLKEIGAQTGYWWTAGATAVSSRDAYLRKKLLAAMKKLESLENRNAELKKIIAKEK